VGWADRQGPPPNAIEPLLSGLGDCQNAFSADVAPGTHVDWHACMVLDPGYATYTFETTGDPDQEYYSFRGRLSVGPVLQHDFGNRHFVRAVGQLVGWLQDAEGLYSINVDDVYAQVGTKGLWNLQAGRFMTWAVFQKGRGFDLYTLEDNGALASGSVQGGKYGVYKYEVNNVWLREPPGRVAVHVYPLPVLGVELAGVYGTTLVNNTVGGRGAVVFQNPFLRVAAGGEYRNSRLAITPTATDPNGVRFECPKCGVRDWYGFGGSAVLMLEPVEAGLDAARGFADVNDIKNGTHDTAASATTTTMGGYLQFDAGDLAFDRSLVLGGAWFRTEKLNDVEEFERHIQMAAYVYFPLGFNNAGLKLVASRATEHFEVNTGAGFAGYDSAMTAARLRFEYYF
jgi:hypothetical protein